MNPEAKQKSVPICFSVRVIFFLLPSFLQRLSIHSWACLPNTCQMYEVSFFFFFFVFGILLCHEDFIRLRISLDFVMTASRPDLWEILKTSSSYVIYLLLLMFNCFPLVYLLIVSQPVCWFVSLKFIAFCESTQSLSPIVVVILEWAP